MLVELHYTGVYVTRCAHSQRAAWHYRSAHMQTTTLPGLHAPTVITSHVLQLSAQPDVDGSETRVTSGQLSERERERERACNALASQQV